MRPRAIIILSAAVILAVTSALARWTDFAPRPFENIMYLEGFASYESDDNSGGAGEFGWNDTFFKEQVTLYSRGYFYHPRFLQYLISVSGALKQEDYQTTDAAHIGWMTGTGVEYEARLYFLPEHPYNLDLFALRYEPLYKEQSASQHNSVETSNGAQFRYRGKPFFFHAIYLDNTTTSSSSDANVKRLSADGQYFKSLAGGNQVSLNALAYNSWFTGTGGLDGTTRDYAAGGYLDLAPARVSATVTQSNFSQDSLVSGRSENDRFSFSESLTVNLPARFRTELSYRYLDNNSTNPSRAASGTSELTETSREYQFDLTHRLYESLDSRYTFMRNNRTSTAGDSTQTLQTLDFAYGKNIPRGRVMTDLNFSRNDSDNRGRIDIVSEVHQGTPVPGSFFLRLPNVDQDSVVDVSIPSPLPPFETIHLVRGSDYLVDSVGNSVQITILPLPPPFGVGPYDVTVSYSLVSGEFELLTNTYAFNSSVSVLDNLLTPYVEYLAVRSDVESGFFPGLNLDSTLVTFGLSFLDGPWRAMGEYQDLQWDVSPYRSLRGEVQYVGTIRPSTRIHATATYLHRYYPIGSSSQLPDPYADITTTATASVQQEFLSRSLILSAGTTYSRQQGRVHGDSFSLSASLTWKIGKLDLMAGASGYGSETQAYTAEPYNRLHQYYYFRIRRQFSR